MMSWKLYEGEKTIFGTIRDGKVILVRYGSMEKIAEVSANLIMAYSKERKLLADICEGRVYGITRAELCGNEVVCIVDDRRTDT